MFYFIYKNDSIFARLVFLVTFKSFKNYQILKLLSICIVSFVTTDTVRDSLASAIKDGNIKESHRLVEMLANAHSQLAIYFVDKQNTDPDSDSEDGNKMPGVSLKVRVIDHENLHSNAAVDTYVENLKKTTIEQMKLRVC